MCQRPEAIHTALFEPSRQRLKQKASLFLISRCASKRHALERFRSHHHGVRNMIVPPLFLRVERHPKNTQAERNDRDEITEISYYRLLDAGRPPRARIHNFRGDHHLAGRRPKAYPQVDGRRDRKTKRKDEIPDTRKPASARMRVIGHAVNGDHEWGRQKQYHHGIHQGSDHPQPETNVFKSGVVRRLWHNRATVGSVQVVSFQGWSGDYRR